jgi:hypothetical protein
MSAATADPVIVIAVSIPKANFLISIPPARIAGFIE